MHLLLLNTFLTASFLLIKTFVLNLYWYIFYKLINYFLYTYFCNYKYKYHFIYINEYKSDLFNLWLFFNILIFQEIHLHNQIYCSYICFFFFVYLLWELLNCERQIIVHLIFATFQLQSETTRFFHYRKDKKELNVF